MELSQKLLCFLFLASAGAGVALGLVFDCLRFPLLLADLWPMEITQRDEMPSSSRREWRRRVGHILLFIEDVLFGLLCGIVLVLLLYFINDGQIRILAPMGLACGFFVYTVTVGRWIRKLCNVVAKGIRALSKQIVRRFLKIIAIPIKWFYSLASRLILSPVRKVIAKRVEKKRLKYTQAQITAFVNHAAVGFELFHDAEHSAAEK